MKKRIALLIAVAAAAVSTVAASPVDAKPTSKRDYDVVSCTYSRGVLPSFPTSIKGLSYITCTSSQGLPVYIRQTTCLQRGYNFSGGFVNVNCSSTSGFRNTGSSLTHFCDYTTFAYDWRVQTTFNASSAGGGGGSSTFKSPTATGRCH